MSTTDTSTNGYPPPVMMTSGALKAYLSVGDEVLARWVAEGMPCEWVSGSRGTGKRLFHRLLVEDWFRERHLRREQERRAEEKMMASGRTGSKRGRAAREY
jgi:hypothetical protein